jgi:hypothetical protein
MGNPRGRPRTANDVPDWFDLCRYTAAKEMDVERWYLNLGVRRCLRYADELNRSESWSRADERRSFWHKCTGKEWVNVFGRYVREVQPLLSASPLTVGAAAEHSSVDDVLWYPDRLDALLRGASPPRHIKALSVGDLYYFERRLPQSVRDAGQKATFPPGVVWQPAPGKSSDVDEQIPKQYASRFVTVSVLVPDEVLIDDFKHWLEGQRRRLADMPGSESHPYRKSLQALSGRKAPKLRTFGTLGVLPYLDIDQWKSETGATLTDASTAELLGIETNRLAETRKYAELLMEPFVLEGWLGLAVRKARAGQSVGK